MSWELSKENALPLKGGRKVSSVTEPRGLSGKKREAKDWDRYREGLEMFERMEDRLHAHCRFIKLALERSCELMAIKAMESCLQEVLNCEEVARAGVGGGGDSPLLKNPNLIKIAVQYADKSSDTPQAYYDFYRRGIGRGSYLFYSAWSWTLEKAGSYKLCESVYIEAEKRCSENERKLIQKRLDMFKRRRRRAEQQRIWDQALDEHERSQHPLSRTPSRSALDSLQGLSRNRNGGAGLHTAASNAPRGTGGIGQGNNAGGEQWEIFQDDGPSEPTDPFLDPFAVEYNSDKLPSWEKEAETKKENLMGPSKWNECPLKTAGSSSRQGWSSPRHADSEEGPPKEEFKVFVETELARDDDKQKRVKRRAPLGGSALEATLPDREQAEGKAKSKKGEKKKEGGKSSGMSCGFSKRLLAKDSEGQESCFEESRALASFKIASDGECFTRAKETLAFEEEEEEEESEDEDDMSVEMEDASISYDGEARLQELQQENGPTVTEGNGAASDESSEKNTPNDDNQDPDKSPSNSVVPPTPRHLFGPDQRTIGSERKHKHKRTFSAPQWMGELGEGHNTHDSKDDDEEDHTINTKLAMNDLGLMFSSPGCKLGASDAPASNAKVMFSEGGAQDETATIGSLEGIFSRDGNQSNQKARKALGNSKVVKLTNADIMRKSRQEVKPTEQSPSLTPSGSSQEQQPPSSFPIFDENDAASGEEQAGSFAIFTDDPEPEKAQRKMKDSFKSKSRSRASSKDDPSSSSFTIFSDSNAFSPCSGDPSGFFGGSHELSRIKPSVDCTFREAVEDADASEVNVSKREGRADDKDEDDEEEGEEEEEEEDGEVVEYDSLYATQINGSVRLALKDKKVHDMRKGMICKVSEGCKVTFGGKGRRKGVNWDVAELLGKGQYGEVFLARGNGEEMAMKVQKKVGSLAWEFVIMRRILDRMTKDTAKYFTPMSSLQIYSDGALALMETPSVPPHFHGLDILGMVNLYGKKNEPIPELLCVYYTRIILRIVECLHCDGGILHCDVKPDNFILCPDVLDLGESSQEQEEDDDDDDDEIEAKNEIVQAGGVKIVDFGRSVDLKAISGGDDIIGFFGEASGEDMSCAAMREDRPWMEDIDTFGVCATAHIMLWGTHMDLVRDVKGKWRQGKSIRRYWKVSLSFFFFRFAASSANPSTILLPATTHRGIYGRTFLIHC